MALQRAEGRRACPGASHMTPVSQYRIFRSNENNVLLSDFDLLKIQVSSAYLGFTKVGQQKSKLMGNRIPNGNSSETLTKQLREWLKTSNHSRKTERYLLDPLILFSVSIFFFFFCWKNGISCKKSHPHCCGQCWTTVFAKQDVIVSLMSEASI